MAWIAGVYFLSWLWYQEDIHILSIVLHYLSCGDYGLCTILSIVHPDMHPFLHAVGARSSANTHAIRSSCLNLANANFQSPRRFQDKKEMKCLLHIEITVRLENQISLLQYEFLTLVHMPKTASSLVIMNVQVSSIQHPVLLNRRTSI
jgi:hypothetical protein